MKYYWIIIVAILAFFSIININNTGGVFHQGAKHQDIYTPQKPFTLSVKVKEVKGYNLLTIESGEEILDFYLIGIYSPVQYRQYITEFLQGKVSNQYLDLELDIEFRDRFGAYYGYFYQDDVMINGLLVANGLARAAVGAPNDRYKMRFLEWEYQAKLGKVGLWR